MHFFDSESVITASVIDGIHLDKDQHEMLGEALGNMIVKQFFLSRRKAINT